MSHDPELIERCAKALCDNMDEQQGLWSELGPKGQEEFRSLVRAVLDEAAKSVPVAAPEPDGPMREVEIAVAVGDNGTHACTAMPSDGDPDWGFLMDCLEGSDGEYPINVTHAIVTARVPAPVVSRVPGTVKPVEGE